MKNNLISIITPSYKSEKFITETIESVLTQYYHNWEMIIVDDFSSDNSNIIIEKYCKQDHRIRLIKLEKNSGPAVARNKAIKEAKGRYIAFLDADDLWYPQKLEKQIQFMSDNNYELTYTNYETMNEDGKNLNNIIKSPSKLNYKQLLKANKIGCLSAIYDTHKIGKVYMPLIKKRQDFGLWLKILKKVDFAYNVNEVLGTYRIMSNSVSSNKIDLLKYNYSLFRNYEKFSRIKSLYYLVWNIYMKVMKK
jgi:glycosyltransferase involved in cell wall biosynthesis